MNSSFLLRSNMMRTARFLWSLLSSSQQWPVAVLFVVVSTIVLVTTDSILAGQGEPPGSVTIRVLKEITDAGPRFIGLPGHERATHIIEAHLQSLGAGELIVHEMDQVVPVVDNAHITLSDGRQFPIYPFWPNGARLCTTPTNGVARPLIYVGDGHERALPIRSLAGAIVAMEYNSLDRWKQVIAFGARAILFLPPPHTTWVHSHTKFADISFHAPRFYVDDDDLADSIRNQEITENVRIVSQMEWAPKPVHNLIWVMEGQDAELAKQVVLVTARLDASCAVPQLAFGAEQAVSAAVLCELAGDLARDPPQRTVALAWMGNQTMNFASLRAILGAAMGNDKSADDALAALIKTRETTDETRDQIVQSPQTALRTQAAVRDRYQTQIKYRLVETRKQLSKLRLGEEPPANDRLTTLIEEEDQLNTLTVALQRNRIKDSHENQLEDLNASVMAQINAELADVKHQISNRERDIQHIRPLFTRDRVVALVALDLTSQGPAFGLYWQTDWQTVDLFPVLSRLGQRLTSDLEQVPNASDRHDMPRGFLSDTLEGRRDWRSDICCPLATAADVAQHFGYLSLSCITADDGRWLVDSPLDRHERLNLANIKRQVPGALSLVRRTANDPHFGITNRLGINVSSIGGQAVVSRPGDAQLNLGQAGCLATVNTVRPIPRVVGTRWMSVKYTSVTGSYTFPHLSNSGATGGIYIVDVVRLDENGRIVQAANHAQGLQPYLFGSGLSLGSNQTGAKSVMFDCVLESIARLDDPRYLQDLREVRPLLHRTGDDPRYAAVRAGDGLASLLLQSDDRWLGTISRGQRGIRMLMTNADETNPKGAGFRAGSSPARSTVKHAATDFYYLNEQRVRKLARHGVTGALTDDLLKRTQRHRDEAQSAYDRDNAAEALDHWRAALAMQQVVYRHVRKTEDDVVVAVIFLLMVLLPFSFYTERLLFNAGTIYGRIAGFVAVMLFMMGLLWLFHPAFRISMTPIVVLLAFVIIVLSAVVIFILYSRFSEQFKRGVTQEHSTDLSRLEVISQAMMVGVANMRRRKIRTTFTIATLVVMTFALLSLSGTQTELADKRYGIGVRPSYSGIMITQMGWRELTPWFLEQLEASYGDRATVGGQFWLIEEEDTSFKPYVVVRRDDPDQPAQYLLTAVMGIGPNEREFLQLDSQTEALFDQLAKYPNGCLLPRAATEPNTGLDVAVGDWVRIRGRPFRLVGIYDEDDLSNVRYLNGQPYGPIDLKSESTKYQNPTHEREPTEEELLEGRFLQSDRSLKPLPSHKFALIRASAAQDIGATLRSVCLRTDNPKDLDAIANDLSVQRLVPVYRSRGEDVELIAARAQLSIVGLGDMIIPLFIGALIVMNTMINAVADQRSTIFTYTSLGLAPVHVGILFLSEAAALGTLGVVGGFIVGQGFATMIKVSGLLSALTLNFSSTAVILTMALVMGIVLLSALYPAFMAGRLAVPAESHRWELPLPVNDQMSMELPFTVSERTAKGAPAFLNEWLDLHTESGVGVFITDNTSVYHETETALRGVQSQLWLAPFDVGVSQEVRLEIRPTDDELVGDSQTYQVEVKMQKLSGQQTAWVRSNRAFIAELRKQFLLWRSLSLKRQEDFVERSEQLLRSPLPPGEG